MTANHVLRLQSLLRRPLSVIAARPAGAASFPAMIAATVSPTAGEVTTADRSTSERLPLGHDVPRVPIPSRGVDYRGKVVLAPMVRSGELPSRLMALKYGADLVWGPETIDRAMIGTRQRVNPRTGCIEWSRPSSSYQTSDDSPSTKESIIYRIDPNREGGRIIYQIGTSSPHLAVQAGRLVAPYVSGIDGE